jgi:predicted nucleotide-binding protein
LVSKTITNKEMLKEAEQALWKWSSYNQELLRRMFDNEEYAEAYSRAGAPMVMVLGESSLSEEMRDYVDTFKAKIEYLDNLAERIDLIDLSPEVSTSSPGSPGEDNPAISKKVSVVSDTKVFVVHGQDNETKTVVARFIEHCGLIPIILHEQTDQGRTIIEKFEQISDVGFAVVLLTPDDVGGLRNDVNNNPGNLKPRARQNVILELGYFIGKLGRSRVCALKRGDVELPSDFSGVVYTPYDGADEGWKIKLARELRAAGFDVDLNKALG